MKTPRARFETATGVYRRFLFLVELLGLEIGYEDDICRVRFPADEFFFNPQGGYNGGLLTAVIDIAMAHLSKRLTGAAGATVGLKTQLDPSSRQNRLYSLTISDS